MNWNRIIGQVSLQLGLAILLKEIGCTYYIACSFFIALGITLLTKSN